MKTQIVAFKGNGFIFKTLSFFLGILSPRWRKLEWKPWHLAPVVGWQKGSPIIFEHRPPHNLVGFRTVYPEEDCLIYTLPKSIDAKTLAGFLDKRLNKRYDVAAYLRTAAQYFVLHVFNHSIPRVLDERFTCWELTFEFARASGQPLQECCGKTLSAYPMITDFLAAMESLGVTGKKLNTKGKTDGKKYFGA